jgi:hypothetical protein
MDNFPCVDIVISNWRIFRLFPPVNNGCYAQITCSNNVELVRHIIDLVQRFVYADLWAGILDFMENRNEATANERTEGIRSRIKTW